MRGLKTYMNRANLRVLVLHLQMNARVNGKGISGWLKFHMKSTQAKNFNNAGQLKFNMKTINGAL